jgi:hypothetical protein
MTRTETTVWTDPELTELIADDPELAAIADALFATGPTAAAQPRRRLPVRVGLLAAALGVVVAILLFAPWNGGGAGLTDRALAAIGDGPVLHVVTERPTTVRYIDLRTGAAQQVMEQQEIWYDRGRGYVHNITRRPDGSVLDDELDTPQGGWTPAGPVIDCTWIAAHPQQATKLRVSCNLNGDNGTKPHVVPRPVPTVDPALGAFLDGYKEALATGQATETGTGTVDGTKVIWLSFPYGDETQSVALDATTYRPLVVRDASGTSSYRIISIGTVSQADANFVRPTVTELGRQEASGNVVDSTKLAVDPAAALRALPGGLWLGSAFHSLPLTGIERATLRTTFIDKALAPESGVGLQLVYGATTSRGIPDRSRPFVQLWESNRPQAAYQWMLLRGAFPPAGAVATLGAGGFYLPGLLLVRDGTYVTVMASSSELGFAAARALVPIGSGSQ